MTIHSAALFCVSMESTDLLNALLKDHLNTMWKTKHGKTFVAKHLISFSLSCKSFCIWGLSGTQENTLCII